MRRGLFAISVAATLLLGATQAASQTLMPPSYVPGTGKVIGRGFSFFVKGPSGEDLGWGKLSEAAPTSRGVLIYLELKGLTPGWHGLHFHEKGDCSAKDFTSAGGHLHGDKPASHGLLNADANESGDLPNVFADAKGKVMAEVFSSLVSIYQSTPDRLALMDSDGSALMVHAKADDHRNQPIGNAGARVACAVIKIDPTL